MAGCKMECEECKLGIATFSRLVDEEDSVVGMLGMIEGDI
jgi:hypothetical protein